MGGFPAQSDLYWFKMVWEWILGGTNKEQAEWTNQWTQKESKGEEVEEWAEEKRQKENWEQQDQGEK
jgi:hypothetical protein